MLNYAKASVFGWLLLLVLICRAAYAEAPSPAGSANEIAITPTLQSRVIANNQLKYFIAVEGTTGLPAQAIIKVNLYFAFPLEDSAPNRVISIMDRARILDAKKCRVKDGRYAIDFGPFSNTPPPGDYYITVAYDPEQQLAEVKARADKEISNYQFLSLGGFKEATEYRESVINDIRRQAMKVQELFRSVRAFAVENLARPISDTAGPDKKVVRQWQSGITGALDAIITDCIGQDEYRIFGSISMYKNMTAGLADSLKALVNMTADTLNQLPGQRSADLAKKDIEAFGLRLEEDLASLGWVKPFNKELLAQAARDIRLFINSADTGALLPQISKALLTLNEELPASYYDTISLLAGGLSAWAKAKPEGRTELLKEQILKLVITLECLLHDHSDEGGHNHQEGQEKK